MPDVQGLAQAAGVRIELADLGDWGEAVLISEYDPEDAVIRINERAIDRYRAARGGASSCDVRDFIDLAIAHELYHHREATGAVARLPARAAREAAADAFARAHVAVDPLLDAFVRGARR